MASSADLPILTTDGWPGREIEPLGLVKGSTVRAKHIGSDIVASLRNLVGGEVKEYAALLGGAREQALDRMVRHAQQLGADAVIGMDISTAMVMQGSAEILAYGTAVRLVR